MKIFRKLRQKLLVENKLRKYLIYALGEIILLVIGILFALQVNNWNVKRLNRTIELDMLIQLRAEYQNNLSQLHEKIDLRAGVVMKSGHWLFNKLDLGELDENIDSLNFHLSRTLIVPTFDPFNGVTEEIINSGKLSLIENDSLRMYLSNWSGTTADLVGEDKRFASFIYNEYAVFLKQNYQVRVLVALLQQDLEVFNIIKIKNPDFKLGQFTKKQNTQDLVNNPNFEDHLAWMMGWCNFLNNTSHAAIKKNKKILHLLQTEIDKH